MPYKDNFPDVDRELARLEKEMDIQRLTMVNNMEYAEPLHNKHGYYVFSDETSISIVTENLRETAVALPLTGKNVARSLEKSGFDIVAHERSLIAKLRPPVRAGEGMRQAHPGGWADITGNLSSSYRFRVNHGPEKGNQR